MQHSGHYGQPRSNVRDDWAGPAFDHAAALSEEIGSPGSQESHFEPQSPSPTSDTEFSPDHHDTDHHGSKSHPKKSKMHQCHVCNKWFPRPSGLATHMNSHSGARRTSWFFASVRERGCTHFYCLLTFSVQVPHSNVHEKLRRPFQRKTAPSYAWYLPYLRAVYRTGPVHCWL